MNSMVHFDITLVGKWSIEPSYEPFHLYFKDQMVHSEWL